MKKFSLLVPVLICCGLFFAFTTSRDLSGGKNASGHAPNLHLTKAIIPAAGNNRLANNIKQSTCKITFSQGSNVAGTWVMEVSSSAGTSQAGPGGSVTVPYGTLNYVGIHQAGGSSTSYNISGSICATSYSASGTSALFRNVNASCSSGSFSVN